MNIGRTIETQSGNLVYVPTWKREPLVPGSGTLPAGCVFVVASRQPRTSTAVREIVSEDGAIVVSWDTPGGRQRLASLLKSSGPVRLVYVSETRWRDGADEETIKGFLSLVQLALGRANMEFDVITVRALQGPARAAAVHPLDAVYLGLAHSMAKEAPGWKVRCCSLERLDRAQLVGALRCPSVPEDGRPVVIEDGHVCVQILEAAGMPAGPGGCRIRENGTYLIIGGAGGLGSLFAEHLASKYHANVVLVGRSAGNDALIDRVQRLGGSATYECVDLCDRGALESLLSRYPRIDGVVHSALVLKDCTLANMTSDALLSVLAPKVRGTLNLAEVLSTRSLDFVLFFSSVQSHLASAGQASYAAACLCKDAIASLMSDAFGANTRIINWGYWGSIGIVATEAHRDRMERAGIGSIEPREGLEIIERFLASEIPQITVIKASAEALARLDIGSERSSNDRIESGEASSHDSSGNLAFLARIVGPWDPADEEVARNTQLSNALEAYSRSRAQLLRLPPGRTVTHQRLAQAVRGIPAESSLPRDEIVKRFPALAGHLRLLDVCVENMPAVFRGEVDPLEVLFPSGSFERVEPVYRDNPIADYFNRRLAQIVGRLLDVQSERVLRILEVGAGTGSTTQFVLPAIAGGNVEYTYTDVSPAFLVRAKRRFAGFGFVRYELWDVERPPTTQRQFDVVIATNVIHATADVAAVLRSIRSVLSPSGVLLLNEVTARTDFATLTFGLTDGWWKSNDELRIPDSPLLAGATWHRILRDAGFECSTSHGDERQQIIAAYAGGESAESSSPAVEAPASSSAHQSDPAGRSPIVAWLVDLIARTMQMAPEEIELDTPFREYGIDSLISVTLLAPIKDLVGYLPATILFEYPTVRQLAEHLSAERGTALAELLAARGIGSAAAAAAIEAEPSTQALPASAGVGIERGSTVQFIKETISQVMCVDLAEVDPNTPFRDFGIDSIISLELLKPLRERFGYLPATTLFEYPSVEQLAAFLDAQGTPTRDTVIEDAASLDTQRGPAPDVEARSEDIAIIGMAGHFPAANDCAELWEALAAGRDCTRAVPADRWGRDESSRDEAADAVYARVGGFIDAIDSFDHRFFNITPFDAAHMDPQERMMLETGYETLLHSGHCLRTLRGSDTGVFIGVMNCGYADHKPHDPADAQPTVAFWSIANRLSYFFDWHGPSMAIDTACSSSLTAVHLACQAIRSGECTAALVGGVNLIATRRQFEHLCRVGMLSRTDRCKPFGAGADGFVDGEGVCAVLLKSHAAAVRDGDRILAVIRASGVNAGGRANGYSAPNAKAQAALIRNVMARSGVETAEIGYVEAHGTGTELGDPLEIAALADVFGHASGKRIWVGSIKGNTGHLESAAGLTGLIKVILQLRHRAIAPSLHAEPENPHLQLKKTPFAIATRLMDWQCTGRRHACVSSFGAGGANAHVVLSETIARPAPAAADQGHYPIVLCAPTDLALTQQLEHLREWLLRNTASLAQLSYQLCCCRDHFARRAGFVVRSADELIRALERYRPQEHADADRESGAGQMSVEALIQRELTHDRAGTLRALIARFVAGTDVPWNEVCGPRLVAEAPGYRFDDHRHWIDTADTEARRHRSVVAEHQVSGRSLAPAAFVLAELYAHRPFEALEDVIWREAIDDASAVSIRVEQDGFSAVSRVDGRVFCSGRFAAAQPPTQTVRRRGLTDSGVHIGRSEIYRSFAARGYRYGERYRSLIWARTAAGGVASLLSPSDPWGYRLSLALLDGVLQSALLLPTLKGTPGSPDGVVPFHLGRIEILRLPQNEPVCGWCEERRDSDNPRSIRCDFRLEDQQGVPLIYIRDMLSVPLRPAKELAPREAIRVESHGEKFGAVTAHELS